MRATSNKFAWNSFSFEEGFHGDKSQSIRSCDEPHFIVRALWDEGGAIAFIDDREYKPARFIQLASFWIHPGDETC